MYKYYGMSRDEYEEYYGERVITCREHNITSIDGCPACDEVDQEIEDSIEEEVEEEFKNDNQ